MQAVIVSGTHKEIAALALEMQGRQGDNQGCTPAETIKESVRSAIDDIAEKSQGS